LPVERAESHPVLAAALQLGVGGDDLHDVGRFTDPDYVLVDDAHQQRASDRDRPNLSTCPAVESELMESCMAGTVPVPSGLSVPTLGTGATLRRPPGQPRGAG